MNLLNVHTELAITAHRNLLLAQRRADRKNADLIKALKQIPRDKFQRQLYFLYTESTRVELDREDAARFNDQDTIEWCNEYLTDLTRQIRELNAKMEADAEDAEIEAEQHAEADCAPEPQSGLAQQIAHDDY